MKHSGFIEIMGKSKRNNNQNRNDKKPDDPQIPRPELRFAPKTNSETTKETGPEPNTDKTQSICRLTQWD
jgi:hypothetical protein